jgi:hypothetical protein
LTRFLRQANAGSMKFWAAASLALLLLTVASAQRAAREYLVRLPDGDFPNSLRAQGIKPIHHAGRVWAVRAIDEEILKRTTESITPAISVVIEFQPSAKDIAGAIADAGGIVTRAYDSTPALAAVVPTSKIVELQNIPGVKRVNKTRSYRGFHAASL